MAEEEMAEEEKKKTEEEMAEEDKKKEEVLSALQAQVTALSEIVAKTPIAQPTTRESLKLSEEKKISEMSLEQYIEFKNKNK